MPIIKSTSNKVADISRATKNDDEESHTPPRRDSHTAQSHTTVASTNDNEFLDVIGVPVEDCAELRRRNGGLRGAFPLKAVVPLSSVAIVLCVIIVCVVPMTQQWSKSLNTVSDTAKSNLLDALELYRRSLAEQAVSNISTLVQQAPALADLIEGAVLEEAYTTLVPVSNDSSLFRQVLRPINLGWRDFTNIMTAWQNSNGDHAYSERYASGFYVVYDSALSLDMISYKYIDGLPSHNKSGVMKNYNITIQSWWPLGLAAVDGYWTNVYKSFSASTGYTIGYTKRVNGIPVPAVIQITFSLVSMRKYFTSMNLTETGSAYLVDPILQLMAATPGLSITWPNGTIINAPQSPNETISVTTNAWLNFTNHVHTEAHFEIMLPDGSCFIDVVPITADGGLTLWLTLVTPERDFLSSITEQQQQAESEAQTSLWAVLGVELFIAMAAIVLSISLAVVLASSLKKVTTKLHSVSTGKFSRTDSYTSLKTSTIKEIDMLNAEVCTMQSTLESFSQYVPTQVVRHLCKHKLRPVVGFRPMKCVIMFLDIVDFTKNMDAYGPQVIIEVLSVMFESFSTIITRNSGTIDKYIGDAIMALWGCPEALQNPEMCACVAVDQILEELAKLNVTFRHKFNISMHVRIGLHFGEVRAGNVGSSQRLNYTVLGSSVNLAARLEPLNKELGTCVLVTDSIRNPCCKSFSFRALGNIYVRGFKDPILVHEFFGSTFKVDSKSQLLLQQYGAIDEALCKADNIDHTDLQHLIEEFITKFPEDKPAARALDLLHKSEIPPSNSHTY
ncbi:adenylate cyclase [Pelomyxa schiedti]|nr:adenylate cyclase [Pelomyxa schiedti]